jgi:hypothetical protein
MRHECVKPIAELAARYVRTSEEQAWADSPEYLEISKVRKAGAEGVVLLAKGFGSGG